MDVFIHVNHLIKYCIIVILYNCIIAIIVYLWLFFVKDGQITIKAQHIY